jgi:hypothetical protein
VNIRRNFLLIRRRILKNERFDKAARYMQLFIRLSTGKHIPSSIFFSIRINRIPRFRKAIR